MIYFVYIGKKKLHYKDELLRHKMDTQACSINEIRPIVGS